MKIWAADGEAGLMAGNGREFQKIGPPGEALCLHRDRIYFAGAEACHCYSAASDAEIFRLSLPTGVCCLCPFGGTICALSQDADCICAFCPEAGDLLFSAPAGAYPRDICPSPCGKYLAAAGGAAGEILVYDENLRCLSSFRVPGAACGVCFSGRGLWALCAVEDGELTGRLLAISPRGVTEEISMLPHPPCCLCGLPRGGCMLGCHHQVISFRQDGKITGRIPCGYPARIRHSQGKALICDLWEGKIFAPSGQILYQGRAPGDIALCPLHILGRR